MADDSRDSPAFAFAEAERHLFERRRGFPFDPRKATSALPEFVKLGKRLSADLKKHSFERKMKYSHDTLTVQCIVPKFSKPIIDEIDALLAQYYGFTAAELDFIVNYDIKYRIGRDGDID